MVKGYSYDVDDAKFEIIELDKGSQDFECEKRYKSGIEIYKVLSTLLAKENGTEKRVNLPGSIFCPSQNSEGDLCINET